MISRIYGIIALVYGAALLVAAFAWSVLPPSVLTHPNATVVTLIVAAVLGIPSICTYAACGLNIEEPERRAPEAHHRHRELRDHCPAWPFIKYGILTITGLVWLLAATVPNSVHPFFASSGLGAMFAGVWTLYVYPIAKRLFLDT